MSAGHAEVIRAFYAELWEAGDLARLPALMHEDVAFQGTFGQTMRGLEAFGAYVRSRAPRVLDLSLRGRGPAGGWRARRRARALLRRARCRAVPRSRRRAGATLAWEGVGFFTLEAGRIRHLWVMGDMLGLLNQLKA